MWTALNATPRSLNCHSSQAAIVRCIAPNVSDSAETTDLAAADLAAHVLLVKCLTWMSRVRNVEPTFLNCHSSQKVTRPFIALNAIKPVADDKRLNQKEQHPVSSWHGMCFFSSGEFIDGTRVFLYIGRHADERCYATKKEKNSRCHVRRR